LKIYGIASGFAFGYDPTRRSVFYIPVDHLSLIVFKKPTPLFSGVSISHRFFLTPDT